MQGGISRLFLCHSLGNDDAASDPLATPPDLTLGAPLDQDNFGKGQGSKSFNQPPAYVLQARPSDWYRLPLDLGHRVVSVGSGLTGPASTIEPSRAGLLILSRLLVQLHHLRARWRA